MKERKKERKKEPVKTDSFIFLYVSHIEVVAALRH